MGEDSTQAERKDQQREKQAGFTISSQDLDLNHSQEASKAGARGGSSHQQALSEPPVLPPWPKTPAICLPVGLGHGLVGSIVGLLFGSITKVTSPLPVHSVDLSFT